ncbi:MAG: head decoration protein [Xanthobacteraceae bacterium]
MTTLNEARHAGEFILSEGPGHQSRENVVILSGEGALKAGQVLGKVKADLGATTVGAPSFAGTGNGVLTKATPAYGAGVKEGDYKALFTDENTDLGDFIVIRPDGSVDGHGRVGVAYDGQVKFTIADGSTDFISGDAFTLAVAIADPTGVGKYRSADPTNTDGSGAAAAILIDAVDATGADVTTAAIVRRAEVNGNCLEYDAGVDDAPKKATKVAELAAAGILVR